MPSHAPQAAVRRVILTGLPLLLALAVFSAARSEEPPYVPAAENLAAREWFQDARFGVFIHWGVYSVLERGEWVLHHEKMKLADYEPLAERFNPTAYDPDAWCALFKKAGARYVTITSKHHDGFALWDSRVTDWDVVDRTPYKKDLLKPLADACRRHGLKLFFYHSHLDWRHPEYFPRGVTGQYAGRPRSGDFDRYVEHMDAQLAELVGGEYGEVAGIWFDGWWDQKTPDKADPPSATSVDWRLRRTYDRIHALRPACLVGNNHHVAPFPGEDFQMFERDLPGQNTGGHSADAVIGDLPLESCDTINNSWGYSAGDKSVKSTKELVHYLVKAAGQGANLLLNVGPKPDGTIQEEFVTRLGEVGAWLAEHGDSIYGTRAGPVTPRAWGVTTRRVRTVYVHVLAPGSADAAGWTDLAGAGAIAPDGLRTLGGEAVEAQRGDNGSLRVKLPAGASEAIDTVLVGRAAR